MLHRSAAKLHAGCSALKVEMSLVLTNTYIKLHSPRKGVLPSHAQHTNFLR